RHIILRALEHDQAFLDRLEFAPLRIGARHVHAQRALLRSLRIEQEWKKIGKKPGGAGGDQQSERMPADQRMLNLWSVLAKGGRLVHGVSIPFTLTRAKHIRSAKGRSSQDRRLQPC